MEFLKDLAVPQSLEHFQLLVLVSSLCTLVLIPYLCFALGSSIVSLWYNHIGRSQKKSLYLQFAHEMVRRIFVNNNLPIFLAILPGISLVFIYAQILQGTQSLGVSFSGWGFLFLLSGMVLLYFYNYTFRIREILNSYKHLSHHHPDVLSSKEFSEYEESNTQTHLRCGRWGVLFLGVALILYSAALSVTANPSHWNQESMFDIFSSFNIIFRVIELLSLCAGITGLGILFFSLVWDNGRNASEEYTALVKKIGLPISIVGLLGLPLSILSNIAITGNEAQRGDMYALAGTAIIFLLLTAHFLYGFVKTTQPITLTIGFALFLSAIGIVLTGDNMAIHTATRSHVALLVNAYSTSIEDLKTSLGVTTISFTGESIYSTRCESCHFFDRKKVGPPYFETVPKYQGKKEELVAFILHPSKKNPDYPPMQNPGLRPQEADSVASYILRMVASASSHGVQ